MRQQGADRLAGRDMGEVASFAAPPTATTPEPTASE